MPLAATDRPRYAGVYALALPNGTRDFTIAMDDHLTAQLSGQQAIPLPHFGNHTFGAEFDPTLRRVFTVDSSAASQVTLHQGGGTFDGPRK